ncbi:MAG: GNAT family N-acetyltransferase [Ktedonobacteraceae bacterium]|nr:GNAT family N-acetyltransferase [Ktedonobacteraceae bacterium]
MAENIRPARVEDAPGITRVHIETWRTTYRGIIPADFLANLPYEQWLVRRVQMLSKPAENTFTYVAEDDDSHIVGYIMGGPEREHDPQYRGELYAIYLLQQYQRRGLGRRLVLALAESLVRAHLYSMLVWVLADNSARLFYQSLGGQYLRSKPIEIGGASLLEEAYGWSDIRSLLLHDLRQNH